SRLPANTSPSAIATVASKPCSFELNFHSTSSCSGSSLADTPLASESPRNRAQSFFGASLFAPNVNIASAAHPNSEAQRRQVPIEIGFEVSSFAGLLRLVRGFVQRQELCFSYPTRIKRAGPLFGRFGRQFAQLSLLHSALCEPFRQSGPAGQAGHEI